MSTQTATEIPENLTQQQAIGLLVQGVQIAQSRGAFNLNEAELISKAIRAFSTDATKDSQPQEITDTTTISQPEETSTTEETP